jgi:selenocysteine lyase/cysteine desulfurase
MSSDSNPLQSFRVSLNSDIPVQLLRQNLIGEGMTLDGPFGAREIIYADYVASGRALRLVEEFIMANVLPYYANSHTEASYCGAYMTRLRGAARAEIARLCGATDGFSTVFAGAGATAGINRLVSLLGVSDAVQRGENPLILIGPYEHHSNILPWRESGAQIIEIDEDAAGGPSLPYLEKALKEAGPDRLVVGAFSLASNVTGIVTDDDKVTRMLKKYGALSVWDCAGGGPYLPLNMRAGTEYEKDAIVVSPHKFIGGPGASGVLIVRNAVVRHQQPTFSGGGTVKFVSPWAHDYSENIAVREEAGTPNVIGDIRAALSFLVKDAIGQSNMDQRHAELRDRALKVWQDNPNIEILGAPEAGHCLPIFSMQIRDPKRGGFVHQQLFTKLLSDYAGVQARGGCACAGPYAHRLLNIDKQHSEAIRSAILSGAEFEKPGWTRLNFSVLLTNEKADRIIEAVDALARNPYPMIDAYRLDAATARFTPLQQTA